MKSSDTQGILHPRAGAERFSLRWHPPSPALAPAVDRYWLVRWDLRGRPPYLQETLPFPCVNMALGSHQPGVHGPSTRRFAADLRGLGWVLGVKFRPGGFHRLLGREVATIAEAVLPVEELFGAAGAELVRAVDGAGDDAARIGLVERFLFARDPRPGPEALLATHAVELAQGDPSLGRVADLAARVGLSVRALERLFRTCVGVPPKGVLRRFRVHEAAERVKAGAPADWARLAQELGYSDQAHLIRDFKAQVGKTPAAYAAACAADPASREGLPGSIHRP